MPTGRFTGRSQGVLNMREGKVQRLHDWLAAQQLELADCESTLYSDSINDLPLLSARAPRGGGEPRSAPGRRGGAARLAGHLLALKRCVVEARDDDTLPLLVVTTVATREQALALAREMVERRLAACAQITPSTASTAGRARSSRTASSAAVQDPRLGLCPARERRCVNATPTSCRRSMPSPRRRPTRPMPSGCAAAHG